jgi:3-methyladenine DNA glycosylase AlkC
LAPKADDSGSRDFKDRISPDAIEGLAEDLSRAWPTFPVRQFTAAATTGLAGLEMKARVIQVADALAAALPADFGKSAEILTAALDQPGFDGWIIYPVDDYVARYGIAHPELALPLIARLTSRWSCEFAIRPFIDEHPGITFEYFDRWVESDDEHLRRLVSEGSRPRLPWGSRLRAFIEDPSPTISLLSRLIDDPSPYVRKSVANHLNDISKDHPVLAVETASSWLGCDPDPGSGRRQWIVSHGLRSLVKSGDPGALKLLGFDPGVKVSLGSFRVTPAEIKIGEAVTIEFSLLAESPVPVMVDYAIHHAGASGMRSAKVFKLKKTALEPMVEMDFRREHRIREVSVRRIHPGPHLITIQVNGRVLASATIEVTADRQAD